MVWQRHKNPEHKLAVAVARYLNLSLPPDAIWCTTPTAGSSMLQGARLKAAGYVAGWPDLQILWRGKSYFIELKAPRGVLADAQRATMLAIMRAGGKVAMAKSLDDVQEFLDQQAIPLRARLDPRALSGARAIA